MLTLQEQYHDKPQDEHNKKDLLATFDIVIFEFNHL
jgi:hypothetical protein